MKKQFYISPSAATFSFEKDDIMTSSTDVEIGGGDIGGWGDGGSSDGEFII